MRIMSALQAATAANASDKLLLALQDPVISPERPVAHKDASAVQTPVCVGLTPSQSLPPTKDAQV